MGMMEAAAGDHAARGDLSADGYSVHVFQHALPASGGGEEELRKRVAAADQLLFMPDLLTYWLSGERIVERTIASTAQMLRAGTAEWISSWRRR